MRARAGDRLSWDDEEFVIIGVDYHRAFLRSLAEVAVRDVEIEELIRMPNVQWHRPAPVVRSPADVEILDGLPAAERACVDAWVEQLQLLVAAEDQGRDLTFLINDVSAAMSQYSSAASASTVRRRLKRYRDEGVLGLLDGRRTNGRAKTLDASIAKALSELGAAGRLESSGTDGRTVDRLRWMLEEELGEGAELPSERTLYRRIETHPTAKRLSGSARTRETKGNKPDREFRSHGAVRPGEVVEIDSTVIDVPSWLLDGRLNRAELTVIHDVGSRSILAGAVRAIATNTADLAGVLARALTPYGMRPAGAREQRERMSATWAGQFLIDQERLDGFRLAQPYIFPETITTDNAKIYRSEAFRRGCERLGISLIFASRQTATDKPHVERTFDTVKTRFVQYLAGFTGGSVERRGREAKVNEALGLAQLQELFEDWIAVEWQNRPHDGLWDPLLPSRTLTPNEMIRAYRRIAPEIHVPFGVDEFIGLLPGKTCTLQDYGVNFANRVYKSNRLRDLRAAGAEREGATRRCQIRYDPLNSLYIWVAHGDEFVPFRAARDLLDEPMGVEIWAQVSSADHDADARIRADAAMVADRMKRAQWARPGAKKNRAVRIAQVNEDPMHWTSSAESDRRNDSEEQQVVDEVVWRRGRGFSLLSDDDLGEWERL